VENAVTACLLLLVPGSDTRVDHANTALAAYRTLEPAKPGLTFFHTRLGLTLLVSRDPVSVSLSCLRRVA
jgi:hypothetical protein